MHYVQKLSYEDLNCRMEFCEFIKIRKMILQITMSATWILSTYLGKYSKEVVMFWKDFDITYNNIKKWEFPFTILKLTVRALSFCATGYCQSMHLLKFYFYMKPFFFKCFVFEIFHRFVTFYVFVYIYTYIKVSTINFNVFFFY